MAAAHPRTAQAARPESKAPDLMRDPVRGCAGWSRSCWRCRGRTRARNRLIRQRPPARAGTGLTDGERRRCRRTQTRARASAELLAHGPQHLRTGAAENRRGQGLALTIAPVQAQAIQARPE